MCPNLENRAVSWEENYVDKIEMELIQIVASESLPDKYRLYSALLICKYCFQLDKYLSGRDSAPTF